MMKPFRVYVGPHVWNIHYLPNLDGGDRGHTDTDTLTIRIADQPDSLTRSTLLHELLHVCTPYGLTVRPKEDAEETFVTAIEPGLFALVADERNRNLVTYLMEGAE